ncbi:MAG: hypothetical protein K2J58_06670 [Muribaculaceae bacterium]|nr:hypothetical protein [Muribaculaceae bacterium]
MAKFNMKRSSMLLGAAAVMLTAGAAGYRDVTGQYMQNPAFLPGWQGALTDVQLGVGEVFNGAFNLYQVLPDMPAGEYVLTANAFYRCGWNDDAKRLMVDGKNHYASLYLGAASVEVKGLFDGREVAPDNLEQANAAFSVGEYVNTVTYNHPGGDLVLGIKNLGCYNGEWCAFDNFALKSGDTDYTDRIKNADFSEGIDMNAECWDMVNSAGDKKKPDVNKGGGVYRKTNASPYNFGQQVDLPAGKYRFSALTFLRYGGSGDFSGNEIISCKGEWKIIQLEEGNVSPKQWWEDKAYKENDFHANSYLYASFEDTKPANLEVSVETLEENMVYARIKGPWEICEGNYADMPENETRADAERQQIIPPYETRNVVPNWDDSGIERESAAAFVNNPEKWRQYVEFELAAPAKVWVGLGKDANFPPQFWQPFADFKLEQFDENYDAAVGAINAANGMVEYYNLQGVRVANPQGGIFIVREGNKTSKKVIR